MKKQMKINSEILQKDISPKVFWGLIVCVFLAKAVLGYYQMAYTWIGGAPIDDELMFEAAQQITAGNWLGEYTYLTLSKQMFFAVWLAFCHAIHLPYLVAGQLLACFAALAMMGAFSPVLKQYKTRFLLFSALAFSPAVAASFTLRVYRDNIFPSECVLFFAGLIAVALRVQKGLRGYWAWLVVAGLGLGSAYVTREDGIWLLPFAIVATGSIVFCIFKEKGLAHKIWRCVAQLVPYGLLLAFVCGMSAMNLAHYGVFTTSDFSQGSFAAAYGAMVRLERSAENEDLPVPQEVRVQLYEVVPELAPLAYWLEEYEPLRNGYIDRTVNDYQAGAFYWVLRRAANEEGVYDSAANADAYWQTVADTINAAVEDGTLTARTGVRNSTAPMILPEHVVPTLLETCKGLWHCFIFADTEPYLQNELSLATAEDAAIWQAYLGNGVNYAAKAGEAVPYYSPRQLLLYQLFSCFQPFYAIVVPLLFALAVFLQGRVLVLYCKTKKTEGFLLWFILFGVFAMAWFRCAMIGFMEVAAFHIGTYVMYLSTVHPLLITFAMVSVLTHAERMPLFSAKEK